jgi:signal transduction histidine kinase/CheY-like chemotaxis protein
METVANRYLEAVGRISESLYARTDIKDAVHYTISTAVELVDADAGTVLLANAEKRQLVFFDAVGPTASTVIGASIPWNHGLAGAVFSSGQAEIVTDVGGDPRHLSIVDATTGYTTRQMIVVPLKRWNGQPLGVLEILNKKEDVFTKEDADILAILSALATAVIEQMQTTEALRQNEAQLREAQKMEAIGALAGGIAHDFNNLVTVIMGYSEMLLSASFDESRWRRDVAQIRGAGQRAAGLTRQLLAFSRRQILSPTIVDVNEVILSMAAMLQQLLGADIQVVTNLDSLAQNIEIDRSQLEQVILNLAVNARDAMEHGGRLDFQTSTMRVSEMNPLPVSPGRYVAVTVTDTGCGMDPIVQSQVFEPFFTTKPVGRGTGLGLSTVYGIVQQSGGAITVQSEVGRGTTFTIYLPVTTKAADLAGDFSPTRTTGSGTILLVEDEPAVRTLVAKILRDSGYDVLEASHGIEALQIIQTFVDPPDLILTDVVMPQMSGLELIQRVRQRHANINVLYMSGYSDHPALKQDVLTGTAFLQKPFTPEGLTDVVKQVLLGNQRAMCVSNKSSQHSSVCLG